MRIVIIHYHLNPGGVTRVIQSQIKSILQQKSASVALIAGNVPKSFLAPNVEIQEESTFNYLEQSEIAADNLKRQLNIMVEILEKRVDVKDIIHVHNLNLGKNPLLTLALNRLMRKGYKVLNHCHDFAEDRPKRLNFLHEIISDNFGENLQSILYPDLENCFYGVLNRADFARLRKLDIAGDRIFYLPNPVALNKPDDNEHRDSICEKLALNKSKKIVTYPVRVIRRKNVGEFILLSALFADQANWLVTLPPKNPVEVQPYEKWKAFCLEHNIQIKFEVGLKVEFESLISASDFCITTSSREGFGLVYLEPWLLGTPVVGRKISYVTDDLQQNGLQFERLYEQIKISFKEEVKDFKDLTSTEQMQFIHNMLGGEINKQQIFEDNPFLNNLLDDFSTAVVESNRQTVKKEYSIEEYGQRLFTAYQKISG